MPKGIIVMEWDERTGAQAIAHFPETIDVQQKTLMQVYAAHNYEEASGIVTLMVGPLNLMSYYTGEDSGYYIVLALELEEESDIFEDALIDAGRVILQSIKQGTLDLIISGVYGRIANYPKFDISQLLALLYQSKIKRTILGRMTKEGYISKGEMRLWLEEQFDFSFVDLDSEVISLVKYGLVKEGTVKGFPSEILFLMNALFITRVPASAILSEPVARGMPESLVSPYKETCVEYLKDYKPSEKDNLQVCEVLADPACYEVIKLLRMSVVTKTTLEKLKKKGVTDLDATLKKLMDSNVVLMLRDDAETRYYMLKSDLRITRVFPEFLINVARQAHNERTKSSKVLIEQLRMLKESYLDSLKTTPAKEAV